MNSTVKTLQRKYLFIWNFERYCNFVVLKDRFLLMSFRMGFKFVVVIESLLDFKSEARCFEVRSCCQVVVIVKKTVDSCVICEALSCKQNSEFRSAQNLRTLLTLIARCMFHSSDFDLQMFQKLFASMGHHLEKMFDSIVELQFKFKFKKRFSSLMHVS